MFMHYPRYLENMREGNKELCPRGAYILVEGNGKRIDVLSEFSSVFEGDE